MSSYAGTARWAFLSPEDTVICREPAELMRRLTDGFTLNTEEDAFVAANRLALEAFRSRERDLAAQVCELEIGYARGRLASGGDERMAMFGLQPVINLIRLHGYTGDLDLARSGLAGLEAIADGESLSLCGLELTEPPGPRLRALARNNCLVETAKIFWRRGLPDELVTSCARLLAKWPLSAAKGPFHAAEAAWLVGSPLTAELPAAGALRRICALHLLGHVLQAPAGPAPGIDRMALADELFAHRSMALTKPPAAAARDLACLGEALAELGRPADAVTCFAAGHSAAAQVDPALANSIRASWAGLNSGAGLDSGAGLESGAGKLPAELNAARLQADDLRRARDLAVARFGRAGAS
jgi:hypothetical protein